MSDYNNWLIEQDMGIFWLKLNRLDKMNSFSAEVATELDEILQGFLTNPEIRVLILSSNSDHFFSAGADIDWFIAIDGEQAEDVSVRCHDIFGRLEQMPFPVIAAIKGLCLTAGLELSICADIIYAAENAKFGQIETVYGITPGGGGTQRLARLIGPNRAKELIFSARVIGAEEADKIGLINAVFPLEGFDAKINRIARKMTVNCKEAIARSKRLVNEATFTSESGFRSEEIAFNESFASGEPRDRLSHFKKQQERERKRKERKLRRAQKAD
ncbi:3-hydroxypropionyl-coenzyme A dehydratase [Candidatus Lokiarchaeum ossiferum]|uniref:3-hydroxypropionyl-coenzyme A dehydratase n=1 Tax=Candidatus Lokiarchaeum ossiferum TaxID=2951803 RepID=A0ABY6HRF2_9ARCH|nr:3-hydroxypropionyl-coenzyme A dehydratase [Candidatus Lokiarchaeum sp. B-35]